MSTPSKIDALAAEVADLRAAIDHLRKLPPIAKAIESAAFDDRQSVYFAQIAAQDRARREAQIARAKSNPRITLACRPGLGQIRVEFLENSVCSRLMIANAAGVRSLYVSSDKTNPHSPIIKADDWAMMLVSNSELAELVARGDLVVCPIDDEINVILQRNRETAVGVEHA